MAAPHLPSGLFRVAVRLTCPHPGLPHPLALGYLSPTLLVTEHTRCAIYAKACPSHTRMPFTGAALLPSSITDTLGVSRSWNKQDE